MRTVRAIAALAAAILLLSSCSGAGKETYPPPDTSLNTLEGVALTTELEYYAEGTPQILTYWENNSRLKLQYGEWYELDRYDTETNEWSKIEPIRGLTFDFGHSLLPGKRIKHTYNIMYRFKDITEGIYRIKADCSAIDGDLTIDVAAVFRVTTDESLLKPSELDYDDLMEHEEYEGGGNGGSAAKYDFIGYRNG